MPRYSIAEAKDRLAAIVDEAIAGEHVTITRDGAPVVELRPTREVGEGRASARLLDEIAERSRRLPSLERNAAEIIREMRDLYP
jgi:prevent-host-death family protein